MKLVPYTLQGMADGLGAVQELDAVGVGLVFHWEGPLDMCCIVPVREGYKVLVQETDPEPSSCPPHRCSLRSQQANASLRTSNLVQNIWFLIFPSLQGCRGDWDHSIQPGGHWVWHRVSWGWKHGLAPNWRVHWTCHPMAISKHFLLKFFFFQKYQGDLDTNCRENPWHGSITFLNPFCHSLVF